jgi:magnesium transporter
MLEDTIKSHWLLLSDGQVHTGGEEIYTQWQATPGSFLWLDIEGPTSQQAARLLEEKFHFDQTDIADAILDRHPPRFAADGKQFFLLLKPLDSDSHSLDFTTQQMAIFVGKNYLVTRHTRESHYITMLKERLMQAELDTESPYQLASLLVKRMVTRYGSILLELEQRLDILEDELLDKPNENIMRELLSYNTALRKMRRIMNYHLSVLSNLDAIDDHFVGIASDAERFHSLAELYQHVITDLIEGYISLNAHQLNQVMRVLTVVTVMFLPLGLLVGIYGMNFENMPELKSQHGYFILLGFMSTIVASLALFFRKKHWL